MVYSDKSVFSIVSQSGLNNVKIDSETNAVFSLSKVFCFCLVYHYRTSPVNFIRDAATSVKNLMNC